MMTEDQILRLIRRAQQPLPKRGAPRIELPPDPREVEEEYFNDPFRPRLTAKAFLIWAYLLRRTEAESRIALVSYREIRLNTGIYSHQQIRQALVELAHYGYCIPGTCPTGPGLPKNYKIPRHIGSEATSPTQAQKLSREAERPRKASGTALRKIRKAIQEAQAQAAPFAPEPEVPAAPPVLDSGADPIPASAPQVSRELPLVLIERRPPPRDHRPGPLDGIGHALSQASSAVNSLLSETSPHPAPRPPDPANADIIQALEKLDQEIAETLQARAQKENLAQKK